MELTGKFLVLVKEFKNGVAYSTPITKGEDKERVTSYIKVILSKEAQAVYDERKLDDYAVLDVKNAWLTPYTFKEENKVAIFINKCELVEGKKKTTRR